MEAVIVVAIYTGVLLFDFRQVVKQKDKMVITLYAVISIIAFLALFLKEIGVEVPSPLNPVEKLVKKMIPNL